MHGIVTLYYSPQILFEPAKEGTPLTDIIKIFFFSHIIDVQKRMQFALACHRLVSLKLSPGSHTDISS